MFTKFFKQKNETIVEEKKGYSKIVTTIHNEFNNAAEILLEEAMTVLNNNNDNIIVDTTDKVKRMRLIGFNIAKQVKEVRIIEQDNEFSKEVIDIINQAKIDYPLYKFITLQQIKIICEKYNLIFGPIDRFEGFVPELNLKEIELFQKQYSFNDIWMIDETIIDMSDYEVRQNSKYFHFYKKGSLEINDYVFQSDDFNNSFYGSDIVNGIYYNLTGDFDGQLIPCSLQICAPLKDMNTEGMRIKNRMLLNFPDPVVLQPIMGGYLILTAWGNEASDPLVKNNEILN